MPRYWGVVGTPANSEKLVPDPLSHIFKAARVHHQMLYEAQEYLKSVYHFLILFQGINKFAWTAQ